MWFILIEISDPQHIKAVKRRSWSHDDDRLYKENYKKFLPCCAAGSAAALTEWLIEQLVWKSL